MKSTDFIKEAPVQYSTTFQGAPESHPMYNTYYQQELEKRKNLPSGEETAKIMAANRVKTDMAKAGATAFPVAPGQQQSLSQFQQAAMDQATQAMNTPAAKPPMTGSKTDPRNPTPYAGPTIPQPAPVAQAAPVKPAANIQSTNTEPDETDDLRGGQSQNAPLPAGGFRAAAQATAPAAQPSPTSSAAVGANPMQPTAAPAASTPAAQAAQTAAKGGWQEIYNMNKAVIGANPNLIKPGQQLKMPDGTTYTVKSGDSLSKIAAAAGKSTATQATTPPAIVAGTPATGSTQVSATNPLYGTANDPRQGRGYGQPQATVASTTPLQPGMTRQDLQTLAGVQPTLTGQDSRNARTAGQTSPVAIKSGSTLGSNRVMSSLDKTTKSQTLVETMAHFRNIVSEAPLSRQAQSYLRSRGSQAALGTPAAQPGQAAAGTGQAGTPAAQPGQAAAGTNGRVFRPNSAVTLQPVQAARTSLLASEALKRSVAHAIAVGGWLWNTPPARAARWGVGTTLAGGVLGTLALAGVGLFTHQYKNDWNIAKDIIQATEDSLDDLTAWIASKKKSQSTSTGEQTKAVLSEIEKDLAFIKSKYQDEATWKSIQGKQRDAMREFLICTIKGLQNANAKVQDYVKDLNPDDPASVDAWWRARDIDPELAKSIKCEFSPQGAVIVQNPNTQ